MSIDMSSEKCRSRNSPKHKGSYKRVTGQKEPTTKSPDKDKIKHTNTQHKRAVRDPGHSVCRKII